MTVYRIRFHGYGYNLFSQSTERLVLLDGFPAGIGPDVVEAIRKAIMAHAGRGLSWDGAEIEAIEDLGRALGPPISRD
jgi:hypothetical protein